MTQTAEQILDEVEGALDHIIGICQDDLETHVGDECGKKIRQAFAKLPALREAILKHQYPAYIVQPDGSIIEHDYHKLKEENTRLRAIVEGERV